MTATKKQQENAFAVLKGNDMVQKNNIEMLLNRAIKFRKSRYVDEKLELFKRKFAPINSSSPQPKQNITLDTTATASEMETVDANGFERPAKELFKKDNIQIAWTAIRPIGSGLSDLGNTSALNAVLQVLTYTPPLANLLLSRRHGSNCTVQDYCFVCALEQHVRECLLDRRSVVAPRGFVGKLRKMSNGSPNHAYSIWKYFMEQLQSSFLVEKGSNDALIQKTTALYQIFGGYIQQRHECPDCKKLENIYQDFLHLSLDITQGNTVEKCLTRFMKDLPPTNSKCTSCQKAVTQCKQQSMYRCPTVLSLHLRRLDEGNEEGDKIEKSIKFEESMNLSRHVTETEQGQENMKYNLVGVIAHQGASGHSSRYAAFVKGANGMWYCMENENVKQISMKRLLNEQAYMLFYCQQPTSTPRTATTTSAVKPKDVAQTQANEEKKTISKVNESDEEANDDDEEEDSDLEPELVDDQEEEEAEKLKEALAQAATKAKVENTEAIVVQHNEDMQSKRSKLEALIEREATTSQSVAAKSELLNKVMDSQFYENVGRWDEDIGAAVPSAAKDTQKQLLKQLKTKRKKVDMYDLDYDRGKVKKVKSKKSDQFGRPNVFQMAANVNNMGKMKHKK
ncbi:uncharacterized protein BYT42DRAFT_570680 [Radiomyces spectabilis]|uniref:uncharacterized protein n=1 Tax=Radiomyces spectabilis TaxID=64574 RepID=UPI002220CD41|nr:uncharacterized protein BYT42DRAFT_570680 [Radiomyces spectabilis]KAI8377551.1 hypothetical protein BYT42DRAFT_570680 [Radiomyces spectabilis]